MKCWTVLALLVAVCALFLGVGHTEETTDDIREVAFEDVENDEDLLDSFENTESEDDDDDDGDDDDDDDDDERGAADEESDGNTLTETENALESVNENPSNNEDELALFKRILWGSRRRRRFFEIPYARKFCKYGRYHPKFGTKCRLYEHFGDEESLAQRTRNKLKKMILNGWGKNKATRSE